MNEPIMSCERFHELLNSFLDSELSQPERERMIRHADNCAECSRALEEMTQLLTLCAEMDEGLEMPLSAQAAWREAVRQEAAQRAPKSRWRPAVRVVGGLAAAMVLLVSSTAALRRQGTLPAAAPNPVRSAVVQMSRPSQETVFQEEALTGASTLASQQDSASRSDGGMLESDGFTSRGVIAGNGAGDVSSQQQSSLVVLRSASRTIETASFDTDFDNLRDLVNEYEGYFELSSVSGQPLRDQETAGRTAILTIRVPTSKLDEFMQALDNLGVTVASELRAEDVTGRYRDTETRLSSLNKQRDRLNELIAQASTLSDIVELEDKLYEVQAEIDSLEGTIQDYDSRERMARVELTLSEVAGSTAPAAADDASLPLNERIGAAFTQSWAWLKVFAADMAVTAAVLAPQLVLWIPGLVVIVLIIRAFSKRRRRRKER